MNTEINIFNCIAFDEPAYCCGGSPECKGCPRYREPDNNDNAEKSLFIDE